MKKLAIWSTIVLLSFTLTGCGQCEHEYDSGVITKEPTFDEEGEKIITCGICNDSYVESIPIIESENRKIYDQMVELCNREEYIQALIVGRDAVEEIQWPKDKVDEFARQIISDNFEYIKEEAKYAVENSDFEILDTLYYYRRGLDKEQIKIYEFLSDLQGRYKNTQNSNDEVEIVGNNLKIGDVTYICKYDIETTEYEYGTRGYTTSFSKPVFIFEAGKIEMEKVGFIKITYTDGTCYKYESTKALELIEEERRQKEREEENAKQEYLANEPQIGMTANEVIESNWGNPQKIIKTTYEWGITEQWCYPNNEYIYFEDGKVTAIQESE